MRLTTALQKALDDSDIADDIVEVNEASAQFITVPHLKRHYATRATFE
jgi:hypothetical protein